VAATNLLARMLTPKNETMNAMAFWEHGSAQATHLFDFTTNDGSNLAYSRDEILAHTNGAYLATPPRVKLMHCVHFDGGEHDGYPDNFFVHAGRATIELTAEERVTLATHAVGVSYVDGKRRVVSSRMRRVPYLPTTLPDRSPARGIIAMTVVRSQTPPSIER